MTSARLGLGPLQSHPGLCSKYEAKVYLRRRARKPRHMVSLRSAVVQIEGCHGEAGFPGFDFFSFSFALSAAYQFDVLGHMLLAERQH